MVKRSKYDIAIAKHSKAIEADPRNYRARTNRGNAYLRKGLFDLAIEDYTQAIEINPRYYLAFNNRGNAHAAAGEYALSIADFNAAIELDPKNGMAFNNRGFTFILMERYEEAEQDLRRSLELNPNNIYALNSMGELCSSRKEPEKACAWISMAIKHGYNNWNYIRTSQTYDNIRKADCFQQILKTASQPDTSHKDSRPPEKLI